MDTLQWQPILIGFVASAGAAVVLAPLVGWFARWRGVVDRPDGRRKLQRKPVPLLGGVAVYLAMVVGLCISHSWLGAPGALNFSLHAFLIQAAFLVGVGICDDVWNFRARLKLAGQVATVMPLVFVGCAFSRVELFGTIYELGSFGRPLSVVWLLLGINAINLIDGMDGLASSVGLLVSLAALAILGPAGFGSSTALAAVLAGSLFGFLVFNRPPARMYLGDAGSMLIGLTAAVLALHASERFDGSVYIPGTVNLTGLLLLMAAPLADTGLAIVRRSLSGRGIWEADRGHIHHRLLDRGFSVPQSLLTVGSFSLVCVLAAYAAIVFQWEALAWLAAGSLIVVVVRQRLGGHEEWNLLKKYLAARQQAAAAQAGQKDGLPFDAAWETLMVLAQRYPIHHLEVVVRRADSSRANSSLPDGSNLKLAADTTAHDSAVFEFKLQDSGNGWCVLRAEVSEEALRAAPESASLMEALKRFAREWTLDPDHVLIHTGESSDSLEAVVALPPADARYRRAA